MEKIIEVAKINGEEKTPENLAPCCATCPHWSARPEVGGGECRINPPVSHVMPVQTLKGNGVGLQTSFPLTTADAWCSKHPERDADARAALVFGALERMLDDPLTAPFMTKAGFVDSR